MFNESRRRLQDNSVDKRTCWSGRKELTQVSEILGEEWRQGSQEKRLNNSTGFIMVFYHVFCFIIYISSRYNFRSRYETNFISRYQFHI